MDRPLISPHHHQHKLTPAHDKRMHNRVKRLRNRIHSLEAADFTENACFYVFMLLMVLGMVVFGILYWTLPPASAVPAKRFDFVKNQAPAPALHQQHAAAKRRVCTTGEYFDHDLDMCAPNFYAPIAFDSSIMSPHVTACDSFYKNMCGKWIDEHTNENRAFSYGKHRNDAYIKRIIMANGRNDAVGRFYTSCLALGSTQHTRESVLEFKHTLETVVGDMRTHADLPTVFGRLARMGYTTPWVLSIERHPVEPRLVPLLTYDSFPAELDEGRIYQVLSATRDITNYNVVDMQQRIQGILRVMRGLRAKSTQPMPTDFDAYVENQMPHDMVPFDSLPQEWNLKTYANVKGWSLYFNALDGQGLRFNHDQTVWVIDRPYFVWLLTQGIASFDLLDWRAFIEFSVIWNGAKFEPELPTNVYFKTHDVRGPLNGKDSRIYHRIPRNTTASGLVVGDAKCLKITEAMLPGLIARSFLDHHMPRLQEIRQDVTAMVQRVIRSFKSLVLQTTWLSDADKRVLVAKMDKTIIRVAQPDEFEPEPFFGQIMADRFEHNMNLIRRYRVQRNIQLWHKDKPETIDRNALAFFAMPLSHINAYYSPSTNTITILAGILQRPFYDLDYNMLSKHAILGSIIGHELSHMLDSNGLYWDENGSYKAEGILSEGGMRAFFNQTDCVIIDYALAPGECESMPVSYGNATLGEDLADLLGITSSFWAYFNHTDVGKAGTMADRQHFFMSKSFSLIALLSKQVHVVLSQAWCESYDQVHRCDAVNQDVHALPEFRVDLSFRNMRQFQLAFGCFEGQHMYKPVDQMCRVFG